MSHRKIIAISGVKNSGKTTLCEKLIRVFAGMGFCVAAIKHDGHDFEADVEGTDSYRHFHAGAYGTAVFSREKVSVVKRARVKSEEIIRLFPEADVILLEGFKESPYPKIELVRSGNSQKAVCAAPVIGIATDIPGFFLTEKKRREMMRESESDGARFCNPKILDLNDTDEIAGCILEYWKEEQERVVPDITGRKENPCEVSCIILAGGRSSRMGRDKAELTVCGKRFLDIQIEKARSLGIRDILVSGYRGTQCSVPVIPDIYREKGPLGGIHACLLQAKHPFCLVIGIDTPMVPKEALKKLLRAQQREACMQNAGLQEECAMILTHQSKIEPLLGIYPKSYAKAIEPLLRAEEGSASLSARIFLLSRNVRLLPWEGKECDFENCNTPEDYEKLWNSP